MKLGFVSAILPDCEIGEVMEVAGNIGYECVELMCWPRGKADRRYAGVTHFDVATLSDDTLASTHELCRQHNVEISGLGYYPNPLAPDEAEATTAQEHIKEVIRACARLEVRQMNTFVGRDWKRSVDENWPSFIEVWKPIIACAEEHGVRVGIENCPMLFSADEWPGGKNLATTPQIWERMFSDIPSDYFGLNYDPSHMVWQHMDYLQPLRDFSDKLFHVHAKDVRLDQCRLDQVGILAHPLQYHTPKLPGMGEVDWGKFVSILGDAGYNGPVCVEVEDRVFEGSADLRTLSLHQSHTYLRNFIPDRRRVNS